jgi:hypothetical protein
MLFVGAGRSNFAGVEACFPDTENPSLFKLPVLPSSVPAGREEGFSGGGGNRDKNKKCVSRTPNIDMTCGIQAMERPVDDY